MTFAASWSFSISRAYQFSAWDVTFLLLSAFPASPVVESPGPSLEGETVRLTCSVRDVFPADHFRIVWMDGERELASESGPFSSRPQNLTSVLSYRVEAKDDNKVIACDILLDMDGVPAAQARRASLTTLSLHCMSIWFYSTFSPLMQYATNRATGTRLKQCFLIVNLRNYFKGFSKH